MAQTRIHRYITREIITPSLLSLVIFTCVLLMGRIPRITEMIIGQGVPAGEMLGLFLTLLPSFLTITLPLAFLLGILLAFGRLSADSEFIALKASGIGLYGLLRPVLILAVICALLTGWVTLSVEPASKALFRSRVYQLAASSLNLSIVPGVFNDQIEGIVLYAAGKDEKRGTMRNLFISDERDGVTPATITAQEGRIISDPEQERHVIRLYRGQIHRAPAASDRATYQTISFNHYDINLARPEAAAAQRRSKDSEMSWQQLQQALANADRGSARTALLAEKHQRIVIAFAPLVLVLVGVPLGLQSQRSGKGAGFALALVVFLAYYVLYSFASTLAESGLLPPALILWLPNLCFLLGGGYFLHCTAHEKPLPVLEQYRRFYRRLLAHRHAARER